MNDPKEFSERERALNAIRSVINDPHAFVDIVRNAATFDDALDATAEAFSTDVNSARVALSMPFSVLTSARSTQIVDELAGHS